MVVTGPEVLIAPDSFKGSCSAVRAAEALRRGWSAHSTMPTSLHPLADGGEGTLEAVWRAVPAAQRRTVTVRGPDDRAVKAEWLLLPEGTAVVELASASGIELLGGRLRPLTAHTIGLGQVIRAALDSGVQRIVIAIGSSASSDGGAGILQALGARLLDTSGQAVAPGAAGLGQISSIDLAALAAPPPGGAWVLTDVGNPLLGVEGAAAVFSAQKGADAQQRERIEHSLAHWAVLLSEAVPGAHPRRAGAGAAGGAGFGLFAWGAQARSGAEAIAAMTGLRGQIEQARLVITGEGRFDRSTAYGKVPALIERMAREAGVPVALVAGRIDPDVDTSRFAAVLALEDLASGAERALAEPGRWLEQAGSVLAQRFGR